jgi:hypothetical protein
MGILLMETSRMKETESHLFNYGFCSFEVGWQPVLEVFMSAHPDESHIIHLLQDPPPLTLFRSAFTYEPFSYHIGRIFGYMKAIEPVLNLGRSEIYKTKFFLGSVRKTTRIMLSNRHLWF